MSQLAVAQMTTNQVDDIDISALIGRLLEHWLLISAFVALGLVGAVTYLHLATYEYTAELRVTPVDTAIPNVAGRSGGLGNVASLIGVNLSAGQGVAPFQLYVESLLSRDAARLLVGDELLIRTIFADQWDVDRAEWHEPTAFLYRMKRALLFALGVPIESWTRPGEMQLHDYLAENVSVDQDVKTSIVTISMKHEDPHFAATLISKLDRVVDDELRRRALNRAQSNVEYLSQKLSAVVVAEHRQALADALSDQEKHIMMASSGAPFSAEPLGLAAASSAPASPKPILVLFMSSALTFLLACGVVLIALPASARRE